MTTQSSLIWGLGRRKSAVARVRLKPGTGGFVAKLLVLAAAVEQELVGLAILGVLASAVGVDRYIGVEVRVRRLDCRQVCVGQLDSCNLAGL